MQISKLDPISMKSVSDTDHAPYVCEGDGPNALKIYFESEANRAEYLGIQAHGANTTLPQAYAPVANSDIAGAVNRSQPAPNFCT